MQSLQTNPSVFNEAVLNVLKTYKLIITNPYYGYLENNSKTFDYLGKHKMLQNLSKSIKGRLNQSVNTEYFKVVNSIVAAMAVNKGFSNDAVWEILATETNTIVLKLAAEIETAERLEATKKAIAVKQQKESEELVNGVVIVGTGISIIILLFGIAQWGFNSVNRHLYNNQEVQRLTKENQTLKSKASQYDQYLKDIEKTNKILEDGKKLKDKNAQLNSQIKELERTVDSLGSELASCKSRPIWRRC